MKTQINEVKRMQQLAGILTEAQSPAEALANEYGIPEYIDKSSIDYKSSDEGWSIEFKMNIFSLNFE
jgi:hypothetical protein